MFEFYYLNVLKTAVAALPPDIIKWAVRVMPSQSQVFRASFWANLAQFAFPGQCMANNFVQIRILRLPWKAFHDRAIVGNQRIGVASPAPFHLADNLLKIGRASCSERVYG